ncbi:MAG: type IV pili twitching motility protein PilT, partial [Mariprofundaceae bacterium]
DQHLLQLWKDGKISEDEAMRHADAVNDLRLKIKMAKLEGNDSDSANIDHLTGGSDGGGLSI